jgi:hypothetical protein
MIELLTEEECSMNTSCWPDDTEGCFPNCGPVNGCSPYCGPY